MSIWDACWVVIGSMLVTVGGFVLDHADLLLHVVDTAIQVWEHFKPLPTTRGKRRGRRKKKHKKKPRH